MKALNEEHLMMGLGAMAGEAKYYFTNHKKWIKRANKICNALYQLLQYLDNNAGDEECEKVENAISLIEDVIGSLERYSNNETEENYD